MKKLFFVFIQFWIVIAYSQQINFSNKAFESYLLEAEANDYSNPIKIDANGNGKIELDEAEKVYFLKITSYFDEIDDIQYFKNLTDLTLISYDEDNNPGASKINLSNNTKLRHLTILTPIASLDISGCANLSTFFFKAYCNAGINLSKNNNLEEVQIVNLSDPILNFELPKTQKLKRLDLVRCHLKQIDFNGSDNIMYLNCSNNDLESIDIHNLKKLSQFDCYNNQLKAIDFSNNPDLQEITIFGNKLSDITIDHLKKLSFLNCDISLAKKLVIKYKSMPFVGNIGTYYSEEENFMGNSKVSISDKDKIELENFLIDYFTMIKNGSYDKLGGFYFTKNELIKLYAVYFQPADYAASKYNQFLKDRLSVRSLEDFRANNSQLFENWNPKITFKHIDTENLADSFKISQQNLDNLNYIIEFTFYFENNGKRKQFNGFAEIVKSDIGWKILRGPNFK